MQVLAATIINHSHREFLIYTLSIFSLQRIVQHHLSRPTLAGFVDLQGLSQLRVALNHYLASSRSVRCNPNRIIITNGAQQALTIAMLATFTSKDTLLMENPGYRQMTKVAELFGFNIDSANVVAEHGLQLDKLLNRKCKEST